MDLTLSDKITVSVSISKMLEKVYVRDFNHFTSAGSSSPSATGVRWSYISSVFLTSAARFRALMYANNTKTYVALIPARVKLAIQAVTCNSNFDTAEIGY